MKTGYLRAYIGTGNQYFHNSKGLQCCIAVLHWLKTVGIYLLTSSKDCFLGLVQSLLSQCPRQHLCDALAEIDAHESEELKANQ